MDIKSSHVIRPIHPDGTPHAQSLLGDSNARIDTSSSVINGSASLIFTSPLIQSLLRESSAEKNIQKQVVDNLSFDAVPKSSDFDKALKELQKNQIELAKAKGKLTTVDPESNESHSLQKAIAILQEKISLFNLFGNNSTALLAG